MNNTNDPRVLAGMTKQAEGRAALLAGGGATATGWKAGLGAAAAMERVRTEAPIAGFLTSLTEVADGGHVATDGWNAPTFEPELAVRVDADGAITAVAAAIELVDLGAPDDLEAVLAGNVFHRAYAVGPWVETVAAADARLRVTVGDEVRAEGVDPAAVLGEIGGVVAAIGAQAALAAGGLQAGDLIITGSAIPAIAVDGPATLTVAVEGTESTVSLRVG